MLPDEINNYLNKRYERYLDYAKYHASCAGISNEAEDIVNEVILNLLEKPAEKIIELYQKQKKQYRELDFFILHMIKLNATSVTSPYRWKLEHFTPPVDKNKTWDRIEIEENSDDDDDHTAEILKQRRLVYHIVDNRLELTDTEREIFYYRFEGESAKDWKGTENAKQLYDVFYRVKSKIIEELERDKRKRAAEALLKTVDNEVKIIKNNIQFKNKQIMDKKKEEAIFLNKEDLRDLLNEMIPEAIKADKEKQQSGKLLNIDTLKRMIFDSIKNELISELNAMSA